ANAAERRTVARTPSGRRGGPRRLAVLVARKWPASGVSLSVSFLDNPSKALRKRILLHMNAWGAGCNVVFKETAGVGKVRIARLDEPEDMAGYWSYIGTEILEIPKDEPTLNLEGFTMRTSDAEFRRVVRHEAGHTLGFEHEHMRSDVVKRIDRKKAIAFFDRTEGWTPEEVEEQVLTPLAKKSIMGTQESDPLSIMCYQLPGRIMKDGKPVKGGNDINKNDFAFAAKIYPRKAAAPAVAPPTTPVPSTVTVAPAVATAVPAAEAPRRDDGASDVFDLVIMDEFRSNGTRRSVSERSRFAQVIASYRGARVTSVMQLRADRGEERTRFGQIIRVHERIKKYTNDDTGSLPADNEMIEFGTNLFDTLFQGDVRRLYDEARTQQRRRRLDFVFTSMIPWVAEKPWEFAYDGGRCSFLATEEIHFIRNVLTNVPADRVPRSRGPLRILVASAQPVGLGRLSIDQEVAVIRRGFEPLIQAGHVEVETLARTTPSQLHGHLMTGKYQIVHFIGHGVYDEERGEGCLIFVDEHGNEYPLGERSVREMFCKRGLSLVFLNACESGRGGGGSAEFNKGVAQALVAHGLPALVANQYSVLDSSATSFAQHFYWSLAQGLSIGESAREARIAVNYSLNGEPIDWAVPVVYARDAGMTLVEPPTVRSRAPYTHVSRAARRATAGHDHRIAVWDIDGVFPALDNALASMNNAQNTFGFELTDLSVPLGVRDFNQAEGKTYLWAERLARRLGSMPVELGVEVMACVTRHWLRDDDWLNIYAWWDDDSPIVIFSVAGFEGLLPEGADTNRAIANVMVTGLTGFYGDFATHKRGPQSCPLAFNEKRSLKGLTAPQKFDAQCRRKVRAKLADKLDALEALLTTFK
ncbi:MAG TPA: CHAT domain-containing protein, partial [Longimicrobiales bacterium]|nr:CHAT domain-containing protein [Longimicrobiales bacterium]